MSELINDIIATLFITFLTSCGLLFVVSNERLTAIINFIISAATVCLVVAVQVWIQLQ
jgi:hypothetical protein